MASGVEIMQLFMADKKTVYIDATGGMQAAYIEVMRERAEQALKDIRSILPSSTPTIPE